VSGTSHRAVPLAGLLVVAAGFLPGCLATTKHVRTIETDMTQQSAWTDERIEVLEGEIEALRSENEALRMRTTDLEGQLAGLGGEVSARLSELVEQDQAIDLKVAQAAQKADALDFAQGASEAQLLEKMNAILEEVLADNEKLRGRIDHLESSAFTFGQMHKVKKGESVASIAARYGVSVEALIEANGLSNANLIQVGQELLVPGIDQ